MGVHDVYRTKPKYPNMTLKFSLPIPPSVNHMYHNTRYGGRCLTKKAKQYISNANIVINQEMRKQHWVIPESKGVWHYVDMIFYMPDRRIRDSHNCLKILLDVMEGSVYKNDYYVLPRIQSVEYDKKNPRVEITVSMQNNLNREKGLKITGAI